MVAPAESVALRPALLACAERARGEWPAIAVAAERFADYLAARLASTDAAALAALHAGDLLVACGCAERDAAALLAFDERFLAPAAIDLRRFQRGPDFADEVLQRVREALLLGKGAAPPRLRDYTGRGPLARFVQVAALRAAVDLSREGKPAPDAMLDALLPQPDPELDFMKLRDREAVRAALHESLAALEPRALGLLRLHYGEELSLEQLAASHRVHRATMARWIAAAREQVFDRTRALLRERLRLTSDECDSLIALVRSRLEASLFKHLQAPPG